MDLGALQRAALGPYRWKRMIEKHHANDNEKSRNLTELEPISTTEMLNAWPYYDQPGITRTRWVPGGRFLLTTDKNTLRLWDAGPVGEGHHVRPRLVSVHTLGLNSPVDVHNLAVCIVDEMKLRVAVATDEQQVLV